MKLLDSWCDVMTTRFTASKHKIYMYGKTINAYSRQSYLKRVHRLVSIHIYNIHMVRMVGVGNLFVFWLIVVHLILIKCGDRIADLLYMMHICTIFFFVGYLLL